MTRNIDGVRPESWVFLLGCQRSGTTWLANIFDASPNTLLFMEPFAPAYGIFPDFPEASYYLRHSSPTLDQLLRVEMPVRLLRQKSLVFQRSMIDPRLFRLELRMTKLLSRLGKYLPCTLRDRVRRFQLLNLNRTDDKYPLYGKHEDPSVWVVKEVRLAGKIPVLLHAFPQAHFVVIIRHPAATVHSILSMFEAERLRELRRDIDTYLAKVEVQSISQRYEDLISLCRRASLAHRVALYWLISYETLFTQLEGHSSVEYLTYEHLAVQPREVSRQVFEKTSLSFSTPVREYLSYSTSFSPQAPGPMTTVRKSAEYYSSWTGSILESTWRAVREVTRGSFLLDRFRPFYR